MSRVPVGARLDQDGLPNGMVQAVTVGGDALLDGLADGRGSARVHSRTLSEMTNGRPIAERSDYPARLSRVHATSRRAAFRGAWRLHVWLYSPAQERLRRHLIWWLPRRKVAGRHVAMAVECLGERLLDSCPSRGGARGRGDPGPVAGQWHRSQ